MADQGEITATLYPQYAIKLEEELGCGNFATVHKGVIRRKQVAIKIMKPVRDKAMLDLEIRKSYEELKKLAVLGHHENILQLLGFVETGTTRYSSLAEKNENFCDIV